MIRARTLHYTARTGGEYRDLRQWEVRVRRHVFRISLNGIHRSARHHVEANRYANPGWSFGLERLYVGWTHWGTFRPGRRYHGPCHLSIVAGKRGLTISHHR